MKILLLTPWYPDEINPNHGVFIRDQAAALSRHHDVHVISGKIDYRRGIALSAARVHTTQFGGVFETRIVVRRSLPAVNQLNFFIRVIWASLTVAREFRPDVVHGNIGYPGAFWAWACARLLNVPFIVTEHTRILNNFRSRVHKFLTLFAIRRAAAVVAVSQRHANEIATVAGINPVVVHNIVNFSKYPAVTLRPDGRVYHIGFLGGLNTPVKGLDLLLNACATLPVEFTLHIGGGGTLLSEYEQMARVLGIYKRCTFYGFLQHDSVPEFMSRLHLFVSASRYESFGIAAVEALACGLPVVATDSGGPAEFITAENGVLVEIAPEKIRDAIVHVINGYDSFDPRRIRASVIEKFNQEAFLRHMMPVYDVASRRA